MRRPGFTRRSDARHRKSGQSLVELALILPVLLLLLLVAIDFGRVFLGWVNLQQMARVAANYAAEHASAWVPPGDAVVVNRYRSLVANDARNINCTPQNPIPDPIISGTALGSQVTVDIDCQFSLITPVISQIVGGTIVASGSATFPVKEGAVGVVPGGGGPVTPAPAAKFVGSPRSGWSPLVVTFTDQSTGSPTSWTWDFSVAATGNGTVNPATAIAEGPHTVTYSCAGNPGDTCTFGVSLHVANAGGSDTRQEASYITVTLPPATGPIAEFTGSPTMGLEPLDVNFQFVALSRVPPVTYTNWEWDFTNDGSIDATGQTASHTYTGEGAYSVRLKVTDDTGATNELVKTGYIVISRKICTVPDFANTRRNGAQARWAAAGFTTTVGFMSGGGNYVIHQQTLVGGTIDPQPLGCASTITVGP